MQKAFYLQKKEEIFESLETSADGLSAKEAAARLEKYGQNVLPKKKKDSIVKIFFMEFMDPLVLLLLVAIIASIIALATAFPAYMYFKKANVDIIAEKAKERGE